MVDSGAVCLGSGSAGKAIGELEGTLMKRHHIGPLLGVMRAIRALEFNAATARVEVEGCSPEQVDAALAELLRCEYVLNADRQPAQSGAFDLTAARLTPGGCQLL